MLRLVNVAGHRCNADVNGRHSALILTVIKFADAACLGDPANSDIGCDRRPRTIWLALIATLASAAGPTNPIKKFDGKNDNSK